MSYGPKGANWGSGLAGVRRLVEDEKCRGAYRVDLVRAEKMRGVYRVAPVRAEKTCPLYHALVMHA